MLWKKELDKFRISDLSSVVSTTPISNYFLEDLQLIIEILDQE